MRIVVQLAIRDVMISVGTINQYRVTTTWLRYVFFQTVLGALSVIGALTGLEGFLWLSIVVGSSIGLYGFILLVKDWRSVTLGNVLSVTLLTGYFVGYLVFMLAKAFLPGRWVPEWYLILYGGLETRWLLQAVIVVSYVSLACAIVGCIQRPLFPKLPDDFVGLGVSLYPFIIGFAIVIAAFIRGDVGYMGIHAGHLGMVPPLGAIGELVVVPLAVCALYYATLERNVARRQFLYAIFVMSEVLIIPMGRRLFFFSVILALIVRGGVRLSISKTENVKKKKKKEPVIISAIAAVIISALAFSMFFSFRQYSYQGLVLSTGQRIVGGINLLINNPSYVLEPLKANVGPRTASLLAYLGTYISKEQTHSAAHGAVLSFSVGTAVPELVWPGKAQTLGRVNNISEGVIHPRLGLPVFDGPNTIITEGFGDFGYLGAILYPLMILVLYGFASLVLGAMLGKQWRVFVNATLTYSLLMVETSLGRYIVDLRNLVIVVIMVIVVLVVRRLVATGPSKRSTGLPLSNKSFQDGGAF